MKLTQVRFPDGQKNYRNSSECELTRMAFALNPAPVPQTDGYVVRCPCHADATASLSLRWRRQAIPVHCFAGCSRDEVLAGLRIRGVRPTQIPSPSSVPEHSSNDVE